MGRKWFGTDGVRGRVGEPPITADFMLRLGNAAGRVLCDGDPRAVVIGKDTRISGYMFESALEAGLAAAGANVALLGPMPTPAVAYLTRTLYTCAGIVISASHNPFHDNGIKFFSGDGEKLPDELEQAIEDALDQPFETVPSERMGKAYRVDDAAGRYVEYCKNSLPFGIQLAGLHIVLDCAHGSAYRVGPAVLRELGAQLTVIGDQPNGTNINDGCGSTSPQALQARVRDEDADLGIALDGDGDRVLMVDRRGEIVDGDELVYIIARARHDAGTLNGGVVGTVMSNLGLEQALEARGIPFVRTAVGDRHIHREMTKRGWQVGGEASGHVLLLDRASTGDGLVTALQVLEVVVRSGHDLHELAAPVTKMPQTMINVPVGNDGRARLESSERIREAVRAAERGMNGRGRVILRPSGTEPLVRVTLEGEDFDAVQRLAGELADVVRQELAD